MTIFGFVAQYLPAFLNVIVPMVLTWRIVKRASRNLEKIDRTVRIGKYVLPRWAAWHIPGALYLVMAVLNLIFTAFIDPRQGYLYRRQGGIMETLYSLYGAYGMLFGLVSFIALPCSIGVWIYIWRLGRNKTKYKTHDVRGAMKHLRGQVHNAGYQQRQIRDDQQHWQ